MREKLRIQDDGDVSSMSTMKPEEEKRMSEWQFPLKTSGLEQQCDHTPFPEGTSPRSISKNNVLSTPDFEDGLLGATHTMHNLGVVIFF